MPRIRRALATLLATASVATGVALAAPAQSAQAARSNNHIAYDFFIDHGLTPTQSAGIVGNLMLESGSPINPRAVQWGGPGRGIAQWSVGERWNGRGYDTLAHYAQAHHASMYSLNTQLNFIWYELAYYPSYGLRQLRTTHSVGSATGVFMRRFEMCGVCAQGVRTSYASGVLASYHR